MVTAAFAAAADLEGAGMTPALAGEAPDSPWSLSNDDDLIVAPAECACSAAQCVLPFRTLDVLDDLPHR